MLQQTAPESQSIALLVLLIVVQILEFLMIWMGDASFAQLQVSSCITQ